MWVKQSDPTTRWRRKGRVPTIPVDTPDARELDLAGQNRGIVEARDGEACTARVRVRHSLFSSTDDWDEPLHAWESGWPPLPGAGSGAWFRGQYAQAIPGMSIAASGHVAAARKSVAGALRLGGDVGVGTKGESTRGSAPFRGVVVDAIDPQELLVRIDRPGDGLHHPLPPSMRVVRGDERDDRDDLLSRSLGDAARCPEPAAPPWANPSVVADDLGCATVRWSPCPLGEAVVKSPRSAAAPRATTLVTLSLAARVRRH
jgi:hypothetical protein